MRVIDISNPATLREIASYKTPGYAEEISVVDGAAYIANNDAGLMILGLNKESEKCSSQDFCEESQPVRRTAVAH